MKKGRPHIIIIGGGVIGASMAFFLSRADARVTLIEKDDPASGSSGACDGLVFLQSKRPGVHLTMALESLTLFESLQAKLPGDIEFRQSGGMVVIETDAEMRSMETYVRAQRETGLDVRLLDKDQALELEPNLSPGIKGCAFSPLDAQVNPINLTLGFVREARKNHAAVMTRTEVLGILAKGKHRHGCQDRQGGDPGGYGGQCRRSLGRQGLPHAGHPRADNAPAGTDRGYWCDPARAPALPDFSRIHCGKI
jgi:sarcosine oxidase subunit beta